jgi:hypothetical protein
MIVLADVDIVHKLVCCDLLDELLTWLECPPNEILVIPTMRYKVRKLLKNNAPAIERFNAFLNLTKELPAANPDSLISFSTLDVGEQQLFAVFIDSPEPMRIITGDKRAIRQVAYLANNNQQLESSLNNHIDCLEGIILGLIKNCGFDAVNNKILPNREVDGVFKLAFGRGRNETHAIEALSSNLNSLRSDASFVILR